MVPAELKDWLKEGWNVDPATATAAQRPTVLALQESALALLDRVIAASAE